MTANEKRHPAILQTTAQRAMLEKELLAGWSTEALAERWIKTEVPATPPKSEPVRDLGGLLWASTDDGFDLHLLTVAEAIPENKAKIRVAVARVDALVKSRSAIDEHALGVDPLAWWPLSRAYEVAR